MKYLKFILKKMKKYKNLKTIFFKMESFFLNEMLNYSFVNKMKGLILILRIIIGK